MTLSKIDETLKIDSQQNSIQHIYIPHYDILWNGTEENGTQQNDTQENANDCQTNDTQ